MINMNTLNIEEHKCVICKRIFFRKKKRRNGRSNTLGLRRVGAKTCSKECSKIHTIYSIYKNKQRWKKKQAKLI